MKHQNLLLAIVFIILSNLHVNAQKHSSLDTIKSKKIKMTSLAFGGTGVLFTQVNNQFTIMTGGRGSATFNNRFTFGGGGWGMPKGVELPNTKKDTFEFFKFGYGGLEFGYIIFPGEKLKFGTNLLVAYGAGFKEQMPKAKNAGFKMFPVLEPSIYSQISLGKLLRLDIGASYRYIGRSQFPYISKKNMSGLSAYVAFLVGTCKCNE